MFKINDRVRMIKDKYIGQAGTIRCIEYQDDNIVYMINFDNYVEGFGNSIIEIPYGHGKCCLEEDIERIDDNCIM